MPGKPSRGRRLSLAGAATGLVAAGGLVAAYLTQHRLAHKAKAAAQASAEQAAGLAVPEDVVHHRVTLDDGGSAHVLERGTGQPIVLLHGITLAARVWGSQLALLGEHHRVLALDLRGHGESTPGRDGFSGGMSRLADDVRQVLDALAVERAVLVGHSMGGMVALQLLVDADPDWRERRVAALALVDTSAAPTAGWPGGGRLQGPVSALGARAVLLAQRLGMAAAPSADIRWWAARGAFGPDPDPVQVAMTDQLAEATPMETLAHLLPVLARFDLTERLVEVEVPALVVVGTHDHLTPPSHARRLAEGLPRAELVELPRAGHMPMLERPRELARLLAELASGVPQPGGR